MRNRLLAAVGIMTMLATAGCGGGASTSTSKPSEIRFMSSGGQTEESIVEGYVKPFTEETGIKVVMTSPNNLGKLQAEVKSGNVTHDLVTLISADMEQAVAQGLIERLDWSAIDPDPIFDEAKHAYGYGLQFYSTIMAWAPGAAPLNSWADFWNIQKYPGTRALPDNPVLALPVALLADGVSTDNLYPLDVDRAFKSLDKIKESVSVWWTTGSQPPQLLKDNEVTYSVTYSGRIVDNTDNIGFIFKQGLLDLVYIAVPKGAGHKKAAEELMHEMSVAKNQAVAAKVISYTGSSTQLQPLLPQDRLGHFPTTEENKKVQALQDPSWWAQHGQEVQKRWEQWKLTL